MQLIRIHRRAGAIVATVLTAVAVFASAASAQVLEGTLHQTRQAGVAAPQSLGSAQSSEPRATEAQAALAHFYKVPPTAPRTNAEFTTQPKTAPTAAIPAPKLAAPSASFHWGDAAIGAAIAMAAISLLIAGTLVLRRRTQFNGA